jgi:hypothetical protein
MLPGWVVVGNLVLAPCFMALAAGPVRIRPLGRLILAACMLTSILVLEIAFTRFVIASCVVLVIVVFEAYWLIPKWAAPRSRV